MTSPSSENTDSTGAEAWFTPGRFALGLTLLLCACFPEVITGRATFYLRDYALFSYPLAYYQRECFWLGELPHWVPLTNCGTPFLAQWNTMCLYPPDLFYLLLPLSWALGVFCIGHMLWGGMGMYYLAFRWTGSRYAAAAGGVAFAFTAVMFNFLMWPPDIAALAWLPWVTLAMEKAWREGGRALWPAALAGAMQMLACVPEIIFQTWIFLGGLLIFEWARERTDAGRRAGRFLAVLLLVGCLTAAQWLPFLDLVAHSQRDIHFGNSTSMMPWWGWANYLVPLFRMNDSLLGVFVQPGQSWICSYYLGVGTLVLALLAAFHVRNGRARLLAGLVLVCLVLALGERGGLYLLLRKALPLLGLMRYPVKFVILPAFLVPLLGALFVGHCLSSPDVGWPRLRRRLIWTGGAVVLVMGLIVCAAYQFPFAGVPPGTAALSGLTRVAFLGMTLVALVMARSNVSRRRALWMGGLLLVLWLDTPTMGPSLAPTVDRSVYEPGLVPHEMKSQSPPRVGEARLRLDTRAAVALNVASLSNAVEHVLYNRLGEAGDLNLLDDIPKVDGFLPLVPDVLNDILVVLYSAPEIPPGLADFLAISHVNVPGKATEWVGRPTHLPWVTGGQRPVFTDELTTLNVLAGTNFNPRTTVYLPSEAAAGITVTNVSTPEITVREFGAQQVRVDVQTAGPALVVIAQTYYHHWQALVDGKPVPLWRANHAFQAVEIPTGQHELKLVYRDRYFQAGLTLGLVVLVVGTAGWWRTRRVAFLMPGRR